MNRSNHHRGLRAGRLGDLGVPIKEAVKSGMSQRLAAVPPIALAFRRLGQPATVLALDDWAITAIAGESIWY